MAPDPTLIEATRAAFEDLLDESPLAPDWERVTGQVVPLRPVERRSRPTYAFVATSIAAVILIAAAVTLVSGRWGPFVEGDIVAEGAEPTVCSLFTQEEVTGIVRDAYATVGIPVAEAPTLLVENPDGRVYTDACDWLAIGEQWVILERNQSEDDKPHWATGDFYQTTPPDQTFEPHEAMPSGVEVDNVLVRRGYEGGGDVTWIVGIDIQVVDDAPQWWRFNLWTEYGLAAEDLALQVAGEMFEIIQKDA